MTNIRKHLIYFMFKQNRDETVARHDRNFQLKIDIEMSEMKMYGGGARQLDASGTSRFIASMALYSS